MILEICECCQCDPCDCFDWGDYEFWGMVQSGDHPVREDNYMASSPGRGAPESNSKMENTGQHSQDRIFPEDLPDSINSAG